MTWAALVWSHALAALLFMAVATWQLRSWRDRAARAVILACALTAVWAAATSSLGLASPASQLAESIRNLAWLSFLFALLRRGGTEYRSLRALYAVLAFAAGAAVVINVAALLDPTLTAPSAASLLPAFALRMVFAIGALVAVHNLYTATAAGARAGVGLPLAALGVLWGMDLTFYALCWEQGAWVVEFAIARGVAVAAIAPLVALGARRNSGWTIRLSRTVAFRSIGLVAALGYLGAVILSAYALQSLGGSWARAIPPLFLLAAAVVTGPVMASTQARAWMNLMLTKHLFAHRYDYRAEWLRFTDTLGVPGPGAAALELRVVKAVADIVKAPGGLLLFPASDGFISGARWGWDGSQPPHESGSAELVRRLAKGRIIELDPLRRGHGDAVEANAIPDWIVSDPSAWAIVPLVHFDRLAGAVLLERPLVTRALDWEDFDLLRLAGRQVASYLAEANAQEALSDATRFDEFNRRFAFIMHDIKNLVSQLTLVTRNAKRHADNPEFRADMIATLQASTARMNDLLARLSQHNIGKIEEPRIVNLAQVASTLGTGFRKQHPVVVLGDTDAFALADPARLEQALSHLIQNAIDASPPDAPVTLTALGCGTETGIEVVDKGPGMTADFVRGALFRPFASTKNGGFGVGAYEARAIVSAMGGRIGIVTAPGEGTRMTIWLPGAEPAVARAAA